jgi:gliding motility-associated-like protein
MENEIVDLPNLPAGSYEFMVNDAFFDTTFTVLIVEPELLLVELQGVTNASCFGFCDGSITTLVSGGTAPYTYSWTGSGSLTETATDLCAGVYQLQVTDANGCVAILAANVGQPAEFIATTSVVQDVSCFQGSDGAAQVSDNGNSVAWNWSSGSMTQIASDLPAGTYTVEVTNGDGCRDTTEVTITAPTAPLTVAITEVDPISCFGSTDGELGANVNGPFSSLSYLWSTAAGTPTINSLPVGTYGLSVTNEQGCEATAIYTLDQPTEILAEAFAVDINCVDGPNAGVVMVENVSGGTPAYTYSFAGGAFGAVPLFEGLEAGSYEILVRDAEGCELALPATIMPPPPLSVNLNAVGDTIVKLGDPVRLNAMVVPNSMDVTYSWSHTDTLTSMTAQVLPTESQIYQVTVIDTMTLCTATDFIRLFVDKKIRVFVPNVFSPNGDGSNDLFLPLVGNDVVNLRTFRVFSRQGQLVWEQENIIPNDLSRGWDGTFLTETLNPGVFVYFAEIEFFDGRVEIVKGDVTLMR